jgi:hypothetical protein
MNGMALNGGSDRRQVCAPTSGATVERYEYPLSTLIDAEGEPGSMCANDPAAFSAT